MSGCLSKLPGMIPSQQGTASELLACAELIRQGYYVFRAIGPHSPFDLVAYRDGHCLRVEVKTVSHRRQGEREYVGFATPANDEWDLLMIVDPQHVFTFTPDVARPQMCAELRHYFGLAEVMTPREAAVLGGRTRWPGDGRDVRRTPA